MNRVTQAEFAQICGVNRSIVHRWIENGRIETDAQGLIDPEAATRMKEATASPLPHHEARKAQFDAQRLAGMGNPSQTQQNHANEAALQAETSSATVSAAATDDYLSGAAVSHKKPADLYMERKAEKLGLEIDKLAGSLVERADAEYVVADLAAEYHSQIDSMPIGLYELHQGDPKKIEIIESYGHQMKINMAEAMKRKMEGISA